MKYLSNKKMIPLYMNTSETEGVVVYPLDMDCIIPMAIFENIFIFQPTYFVCVQFVLRTTAFYVSFGSQKAVYLLRSRRTNHVRHSLQTTMQEYYNTT
jgi:hypothetical protein